MVALSSELREQMGDGAFNSAIARAFGVTHTADEEPDDAPDTPRYANRMSDFADMVHAPPPPKDWLVDEYLVRGRQKQDAVCLAARASGNAAQTQRVCAWALGGTQATGCRNRGR